MSNETHQHPEQEQLLAFGLGKLGPDESEKIAQHLDHCDDCSETIVNLQDDTFVSLVRSSPAPAPMDEVELRGGESPAALPEVTVDIESGATGSDESSHPALPPELREHPRYEILGLLGHGGMGDVYKAQHKVMNRVVALKVIKPELVRSNAAVGRFRREVQAAARLRHPNIVTAHDAEQAGRLHYLVMEYVDGENLDEIIRRDGPLSVKDACDYIRQAAEGLQHARDLGMVHRDIKPHNLMIERQTGTIIGSATVVKILDFGLANFANEVAAEELDVVGDKGQAVETDEPDLRQIAPGASIMQQLTQMGTMMGTPDYMAPEQAQDAHAADIRADIYSLGCTFYTLLTGRAPFSEGSVLEKVKAHTQQAARPLSEFRDDVPQEVAAIVRKMMAKDPVQRYQTPAEVVDALQRFIDERVEAALRERGAGAAPPRATTPVGSAEESGGRKHLYSAANGLMAVGLLNVVYMPFFVYNIDALMRSPWPVWLKVPFLIYSSFALPWGLLMMQGAWRMMNRQSYRWSMAAAIMAVIPLTPVNLVLGLAFGVWALLLLVRPEVKAEFGYEIPVSLKSKLRVSEKPASSHRRPLAITAILFFSFALTAAGVVVYVELGKTTVKFEIEDPTLEVRFAGESITVENDGEPIRIQPYDDQHVLVQRGDTHGQVASFTLSKGDKVVLRVAVVNGNPLIIPSPRGDALALKQQRIHEPGPPEEEGSQLVRIEELDSIEAKSDVIDGMSLSHDGGTLAIIGWDSQVDLFDVRNPNDIRKVASYTTAIHDHHRPLALSPDGKTVVAPGEKGLDLRETSSGKIVRPLAAQRNLYSFVAFTPDGKTVLSSPRASSWGPVVQWDAATGDKIRAFPIDANDVVQRIVISPEGRYFALQFERVHKSREHLLIWDIETGRPALKLPHAGATAADFLPNRREVVTWSPLDRRLRFWRLADGRETRSAPMEHRGQSFVLPGGKSALVASNPPEGSILYLVDLETGRELDRIAAEDHIAQRVAVSPDGRNVFSAGGFDSNSRKEEDHDLHVWRLLPESVGLESAKHDGPLSIAGHLEGHAGAVSGLAWHPDGRRAVSISGAEGQIRMWDVGNRRTLWTSDVAGDPSGVGAVTISPDGKHVAAGDTQGVIHLLDAETGKSVKTWQGHDNGVTVLAFAPGGDWIAAVGDQSGPARVWEVATGKAVSTRDDAPDAHDVAFSDDGLFMFTAGNVFNSRRIETDKDGNKRFGASGSAGSNEVHSVAVTADGTLIAYGQADGRIVHRQRTGPPAYGTLGFFSHHNGATEPLHQGAVTSLAFTPDGRRLISGGLPDARLRPELAHSSLIVSDTAHLTGKQPAPPTKGILKQESAKRLLKQRSVAPIFRHIALSPDGRTLLTAGGSPADGDYRVHVWRLPERVRPKPIIPPSGDPTVDGALQDALAVYTFEEETFYREQGRSRVRDVSGNEHDASVEDEKMAYSPDGQVGGALACNRKAASLPDFTLPAAKMRLPETFLSGRDEYTLAMWVRDSGKPTTPSGKSVRTLFQEGFPKGTDAVFPLSVNFAEQRLRAFYLGELVDAPPGAPLPRSEADTPDGTIPKDQWFFLALTLLKQDDAGVLRITIDEKTYHQPFASIPTKPKDGFALVGGIDGLVDELAIFGRALTEDEVNSLREHGRAGKPLVGKSYRTRPLLEKVSPRD